MVRLLAGLALVLGASAASAQDAFAVDDVGDLYRIHLPTATSVRIGFTGFYNAEALAYNPISGTLYGANSVGSVFTLDPTTGAATFVGSTGLGPIEGMDFAGDTLYVTNSTNPVGLYRLNATSLGAIHFMGANFRTGVARSLAFSTDLTRAYFLGDDPGSQGLYTMNLADATSAFVGTVPNFSAAIDNVGGKFWALGDHGEVYGLDETTGAQTLIGNTGGQSWRGMTDAAPVPEPASMVVLGAGLAALSRRRRA